jgi:hypothetical protein
MAKPMSDRARAALRWYQASPGVILHYVDCAAGLNIPDQAKDVNAALIRMVTRHPEYGIERVGNHTGQYMFRPDRVNNPLLPAVVDPPDPDKPPGPGELIEVVGVLDGVIIARDTTSRLYRLVPSQPQEGPNHA